MKKRLGRAAVALIAAAMLGMTSCALSPEGYSQRFQEAEYADLVIRYSTDETIYRLKPDGRDGLFMRIFDRDDICAQAADHHGGRYMAVVVIDRFYSEFTERDVIDGWVASFKPLNYQRVVFLRSNDSESINGLRVVADVQVAQYAFNDLPRPQLGKM